MDLVNKISLSGIVCIYRRCAILRNKKGTEIPAKVKSKVALLTQSSILNPRRYVPLLNIKRFNIYVHARRRFLRPSAAKTKPAPARPCGAGGGGHFQTRNGIRRFAFESCAAPIRQARFIFAGQGVRPKHAPPQSRVFQKTKHPCAPLLYGIQGYLTDPL